MKQINQAYIGLDIHARQSYFGAIDQHGHQISTRQVTTEPNHLVEWIQHLPASDKYLAIEEGPLAQWIYWQLREYVDELIVCDPKRNYWISRSTKKNDELDAMKLARLYRMGELKAVWHPPEKNERALFAAAARHYTHMRSHQTRLKQQIKALYRRWGVFEVDGEALYGAARQRYLEQVSDTGIGWQLRNFYSLLDQAVAGQQAAKAELFRRGAGYREIAEFLKIPGMGPIGSHLFSAIVQTPHRFPRIKHLWSWSRLAVTDRSSDGKPLGYERLDPNGRSELKDLSYRAWKAGACQRKDDNEVKRFYQRSLEQSNNSTNARLNTQRKILHVLWTLWRKGLAYDPHRF